MKIKKEIITFEKFKEYNDMIMKGIYYYKSLE